MCCVPIGIRSGSKAFGEWAESLSYFVKKDKMVLDDWISRQARFLYGDRGVSRFALAFAFLTVGTHWAGQTFNGMTITQMLVPMAILSSTGFVCGIGLACIFLFSRIIWKLGRFAVRVESHQFGIMSTGSVMAKCYVTAAVIWLLYTLSTPWAEKRAWITMALLGIPPLVLFVGSFALSQFPLHKRMLDYKRLRVMELQERIRALEPASPDGLTEEIRKKIEFYRLTLLDALALPEWPFSFGNVSGVFVSSATAVLPVLLKGLPWGKLLDYLNLTLANPLPHLMFQGAFWMCRPHTVPVWC